MNTSPANRTPNGWRIFDAATPVLTYEYSFGIGAAVAIAVGTGDGLVVVSPPSRVSAGVMDDLARFGPVRALVAPNAHHHRGLTAWRERFPEAPVFAPAQAIERLRKKAGQQGVRPLGEAASLTGPRLQLVDLPHCKTGEALVRIKSARGLVWFLADVVTNMPVLPGHPMASLLFKLSGSAPGLKFNNLAGLLMVKDKPALKKWFTSQIDASAPNWFIPSHGKALELGSNPEPLRQVFAAH
jgi:hypothetical protein